MEEEFSVLSGIFPQDTGVTEGVYVLVGTGEGVGLGIGVGVGVGVGVRVEVGVGVTVKVGDGEGVKVHKAAPAVSAVAVCLAISSGDKPQLVINMTKSNNKHVSFGLFILYPHYHNFRRKDLVVHLII
jgi:hypothetical protein